MGFGGWTYNVSNLVLVGWSTAHVCGVGGVLLLRLTEVREKTGKRLDRMFGAIGDMLIGDLILVVEAVVEKSNARLSF